MTDEGRQSTVAVEEIAKMPRLGRQRLVSDWAIRSFGLKQAMDPRQRAIRLLEEAVEAYQAAGADKTMAHLLVDFVFERPKGELGQEFGGVSVTLLAFAQATGFNAEQEECREIARVLNKPTEEFVARNAAKNAAGFDATK